MNPVILDGGRTALVEWRASGEPDNDAIERAVRAAGGKDDTAVEVLVWSPGPPPLKALTKAELIAWHATIRRSGQVRT